MTHLSQNLTTGSHHWQDFLPIRPSVAGKAEHLLKPSPWGLAPKTVILRYLLAILGVLATAALVVILGPLVSEDNDMLFYLGTLIFLSLHLGRGPSLLACVISLSFLSLGKAHSGFAITRGGSVEYLLSFAMFFLTSHIVSSLSTFARQEAWKADQRAESLDLLTTFSRACAETSSLSELDALWDRTVQKELGSPLPVTQSSEQTQTRENKFWNSYIAELSSIRKVTEQAFLQEQERRQALVLQETQRVQSALINSMSHDIQTPLASILGIFELLQDSQADLPEERQKKLYELGQSQTKRLLTFCRNMINLGKLEGGGIRLSNRPVALAELVRCAMEPLDSAQQRRLIFETLDDCEIRTRGDRLLLSQVVYNLLDNALKFSPETKPVVLKAGNKDGYAYLSIIDQGVGIPAQEHQLIFHRFQQGTCPENVTGSGLGLHICLELTKLHGGTIEVSSISGKGSTFTLKLPALDESITSEPTR